MPILDSIIGTEKGNPPPWAEAALEDDRYYRILTYLYLPLQYASFLWGAWLVTTGDLSTLSALGLTLTVGAVGGIGIANAHELGHKKDRLERWLAKVVLAQTGYGHFEVEHNRGHHTRVATPEDPATARFGETFWAFFPRSVVGGIRSGWGLERRRLARRGHGPWHPSNDVVNAWAMTVVLFGATIAWLGPAVIPFLVVQAIFGFSLLEVVNYLEHYGLLREQDEDGRYERTRPRHSWNSDHIATNVVLYGLERHSDHHAHPTRRYQTLRTFGRGPPAALGLRDDDRPGLRPAAVAAGHGPPGTRAVRRGHHPGQRRPPQAGTASTPATGPRSDAAAPGSGLLEPNPCGSPWCMRRRRALPLVVAVAVVVGCATQCSTDSVDAPDIATGEIVASTGGMLSDLLWVDESSVIASSLPRDPGPADDVPAGAPLELDLASGSVTEIDTSGLRPWCGDEDRYLRSSTRLRDGGAALFIWCAERASVIATIESDGLVVDPPIVTEPLLGTRGQYDLFSGDITEGSDGELYAAETRLECGHILRVLPDGSLEPLDVVLGTRDPWSNATELRRFAEHLGPGERIAPDCGEAGTPVLVAREPGSGRLVVAGREGLGNDWKIWVVDDDATAVEELGDLGSQPNSIEWSPDGRSLLVGDNRTAWSCGAMPASSSRPGPGGSAVPPGHLVDKSSWPDARKRASATNGRPPSTAWLSMLADVRLR